MRNLSKVFRKKQKQRVNIEWSNFLVRLFIKQLTKKNQNKKLMKKLEKRKLLRYIQRTKLKLEGLDETSPDFQTLTDTLDQYNKDIIYIKVFDFSSLLDYQYSQEIII